MNGFLVRRGDRFVITIENFAVLLHVAETWIPVDDICSLHNCQYHYMILVYVVF